jgi:hypothetical protein
VSFRKTTHCAKCNEEQPYRRVYEKNRFFWACLSCGTEVLLPSKFRNKPTASKLTLGPSGKPRVFQSKREANREPVLVAMQNVGAISELRYQVPFRLEVYSSEAVDALLSYIDDIGSDERALCQFAETVRRSRQHVTTYKADYTYRDDKGRLVVEDPKGARTQLYTIKKRLMRACHNVEIAEPSEGGVEQRARGAGVRGRGTGSRLKGGR